MGVGVGMGGFWGWGDGRRDVEEGEFLWFIGIILLDSYGTDTHTDSNAHARFSCPRSPAFHATEKRIGKQ